MSCARYAAHRRLLTQVHREKFRCHATRRFQHRRGIKKGSTINSGRSIHEEQSQERTTFAAASLAVAALSAMALPAAISPALADNDRVLHAHYDGVSND